MRNKLDDRRTLLCVFRERDLSLSISMIGGVKDLSLTCREGEGERSVPLFIVTSCKKVENTASDLAKQSQVAKATRSVCSALSLVFTRKEKQAKEQNRR